MTPGLHHLLLLANKIDATVPIIFEVINFKLAVFEVEVKHL
jgi:hypothetical protein